MVYHAGPGVLSVLFFNLLIMGFFLLGQVKVFPTGGGGGLAGLGREWTLECCMERPMTKAPVFEETYRSYLRKLNDIDLVQRGDRLGAVVVADALEIELCNRVYRVSGSAITDREGGAVDQAIRIILARYVIACPEGEHDGPDPLMSYREFPDAAPLLSYFSDNVVGAVERRFAGKAGLLGQRGRALGGEIVANPSYDLSLQFAVLPRIPVLLNFNDHDELFPAVCSVLFRSSARRFLDMECLAMAAVLLAVDLTRE